MCHHKRGQDSSAGRARQCCQLWCSQLSPGTGSALLTAFSLAEPKDGLPAVTGPRGTLGTGLWGLCHAAKTGTRSLSSVVLEKMWLSMSPAREFQAHQEFGGAEGEEAAMAGTG